MRPIPRGEDDGDTKSGQFDAVEGVASEGKRQPKRSCNENGRKAVPQNRALVKFDCRFHGGLPRLASRFGRSREFGQSSILTALELRRLRGNSNAKAGPFPVMI